MSFFKKTEQAIRPVAKARASSVGNHPVMVDQRLEFEKSLRRFEEWKRRTMLEQQKMGKK